jgi:N-sulfoglucosamine sulfohydrolase
MSAQVIFRTAVYIAVTAATNSYAVDRGRPNILLCLADDWSWMNAGCYGDSQARTPNVDILAAKGIRFEHAYCASPSCSPSRAALLTGRMPVELKEAANLNGGFQNSFLAYPDLLEKEGYFSGSTRKGWGPGNWKDFGWTHNPAGQSYKDFDEFLKKRPIGKPFCFWFGSTDPHLPYENGYAEACGFVPEQIAPPPFLINTPGVRKDFSGYLAAIARFDREVGEIIKRLDEMGELDNTLVVISSDNGMPFPRAKTCLYDAGTRIPLIVYWGNGSIGGGRVVSDFVSLPDLAPTFLEAAGALIPDEMSAHSLMPLLTSTKSGRIDSSLDYVVTCRERHCPAQADSWGGYPMRAIRTDDFLYIRNYEAERWPQGVDPFFTDVDRSACKDDYVKNLNNPEYKKLIDVALAQKPEEELYDLQNDPNQVENIAYRSEFADIKQKLSEKMKARLLSVSDPRMVGDGKKFDSYEWFSGWKHPQLGGSWKECGQKGAQP